MLKTNLPTPDISLFKGEGIGWQLSPEPFALTPEQDALLTRLGPLLYRFWQASDALYQQATHPKQPMFAWVAEYLNLGKPPALVDNGLRVRLDGN
jgi:hypothetical protein